MESRKIPATRRSELQNLPSKSIRPKVFRFLNTLGSTTPVLRPIFKSVKCPGMICTTFKVSSEQIKLKMAD